MVLEFFRKFLDVYRPDVMLTYGGDPITLGMIAQARSRRIPVVFALHNFAYTNARCSARRLLPRRLGVCSLALSRTVGLDCHALSYPVDWNRVRAPTASRGSSRLLTRASRKGFIHSRALPTSWAGAGRIFRCWWSRAGAPRKRSAPAASTSKPQETSTS